MYKCFTLPKDLLVYRAKVLSAINAGHFTKYDKLFATGI
jgi:hypothetical protein